MLRGFRDKMRYNNSNAYYEGDYNQCAYNNKEVNLNICSHLERYITDIKNLIFKPKSKTKDFFQFDNKIQVFLNDNTIIIMINITDRCSLSCNNCNIDGNQIKINVDEKEIVKNVKNILEYYSNQIEKCDLVFYGGDPLVDFNKILYIHDNLGGNYHINIITNGFLLTDEIIKVIINRDISVYVNFDLGTKNKICERIKDNLLKYKKKYAYSNNIKIITHYNFHSNLEKLDKFYEESKLQIAILKEDYSDNLKYYDKIEQSIIDGYLEQYRKLTNKYKLYKKQGKECSSFLKQFLNYN